MKRFRFLLAMLALGLALVGCSNDPPKDPPVITRFIVTTADNIRAGPNSWVPMTTFTTGQALGVGITLSSPYQDLAKIVFTVKSGGTVIQTRDYDGTFLKKGGTSNSGYSSFTFPVGSYTAEVYAEDIDGTKSNTMTVSFTVQ